MTTITILVVDDDAAIRSLILDVLESAAFRVLTAATGAQALVESEAEAGPIHLLLTDVLMPDVNGPELFRRLRTRRPEMRVLYMTGLEDAYTDDPAWFEVPVIHQPFTVASLFAAVRDALG